MKLTILEYNNEYGEMAYYGCYDNLSPKQAIKHYLKENNLEEDNPKIEDGDFEVWVEGVCRAYQDDVQTIL